MTAHLLELRDVTTGYGKVEVLHDLTLSVPAGSVVALIGPNGAGKTTTLRALAGTLPVWRGSITFDGARIDGLRAVDRARRRIWIASPYFLPPRSFRRALRRASARGVDVRILVGGPLTDIRAARLVAHGRYETLLEAGVRVFEYQPTTLHAKTFVVDGRWVSIGTMNFDNRSLALNDESTLMVLDSAAGRRMEEVYLEDQRHSREIDLATFRRRPWYRRVGEWAASQITRLL